MPEYLLLTQDGRFRKYVKVPCGWAYFIPGKTGVWGHYGTVSDETFLAEKRLAISVWEPIGQKDYLQDQVNEPYDLLKRLAAAKKQAEEGQLALDAVLEQCTRFGRKLL